MNLKGFKNQVNVYQCALLHTSKYLFKIEKRPNFIIYSTDKYKKKLNFSKKKCFAFVNLMKNNLLNI